LKQVFKCHLSKNLGRQNKTNYAKIIGKAINLFHLELYKIINYVLLLHF
jgi:hypothetical protein